MVDRVLNMQQKAMQAKEKSEELIQYLESKTLPEKDIKISQCETIIHTPTFIELNKHRLNVLPILSRYWVTSYMNLYKLKKAIEHDY